MVTDTIADMITRIRNCNLIGVKKVEMPSSALKFKVAEALKREGYLTEVEVKKSESFPVLKLRINVGPNGEKSFTQIKRVSKPGKRTYTAIKDLKPVQNGLGNMILSTSKGVLSDKEARQQNVGGECLFLIQ